MASRQALRLERIDHNKGNAEREFACDARLPVQPLFHLTQDLLRTVPRQEFHPRLHETRADLVVVHQGSANV